ncbi:MAG: aldo/keto reductase [Microlunatus sp.]|nr:aldo/keto reductase [Microlunatus sp.]MDN5804349.1 aldo/keto reductase [Microlunatus sp.]
MSDAPIPTLSLRHGAAIPVLGLGTWPMRGDDAAAAVRTALQTGYRLLDTAENYRNEDAVGQGIRDSGIDRSEVFITTKLNREWHSVDGVQRAFAASAERLGVDYIDLLMVHWPNPDQDRYIEAVRGLDALLDDGVIKAIGVSNFKPAHLQRVIDEAGLVPDVNQIELSPYSTRDATRAFDAEHGIITQSYSPIGASDAGLRSDPLATQIGERYGKSATQAVLRWHVQLGLVAIPKSSNPSRIAENIDIFDFELTADEMAAISALDQGEANVADSDTTGH